MALVGTAAWGADRQPVVAERPAAGTADSSSSEENSSVRSNRVVTPEEKIRFEQDKAQAHMRELESRMFAVAELLREAQPDDSARLIMGVAKSRDQLIVEQMREASELISTLDLTKATAEEKELIAKLEELKRLLLTTDLDLELRLEQLRRLRGARETLGRLTARERQQLAQTEPLAEKKPDAKTLAGLKSNEERNQRSGQDLEQTVKRLGPVAASAAGALGGACNCMGSASQCLGNSQPKNAAGQQSDAVKKLQAADKALQQAEAKLKQEIESLARQRVIENLTKMIAQQKSVREATRRLVPRVAVKQRQAVLAVRQLAPLEESISGLCRSSIELAELAQVSVVLPTALTAVDADMNTVADALRDGRADEGLVTTERKIESDLQALLDALKDAVIDSDQKPSQCKCCGCNKNKLLAEVRMLRWMEAGLNGDTRRVDTAKGQNMPAAEATARTADLERRQTDIEKIAARLHAMTCPHCLEEGGGE